MFHFKAKISKVGSSYAVILPKPVIEFFKLEKGSELILTADDNGIQISVPLNPIVEEFLKFADKHKKISLIATNFIDKKTTYKILDLINQSPQTYQEIARQMNKPNAEIQNILQQLVDEKLIHLNSETLNYEITNDGHVICVLSAVTAENISDPPTTLKKTDSKLTSSLSHKVP